MGQDEFRKNQGFAEHLKTFFQPHTIESHQEKLHDIENVNYTLLSPYQLSSPEESFKDCEVKDELIRIKLKAKKDPEYDFIINKVVQ